MTTTHLWIDASRGVAGDMLLGALLDAGASLEAVRSAVEAVLPATVAIESATAQRAGMRGIHVRVDVRVPDQPHRDWTEVRRILEQAGLAEPVRARALRTFGLLAEAEARAHGIEPDRVHFHEVGAWDSIADVVGVCAAVEDLGIDTVSAGPVALGSGSVHAAHGDIPVPVPAVLELSRGWQVLAGGQGELATPTGLALVRALAETCGPLPALTPDAVGVGAGTRDTPGRPNVVRVVVGRLEMSETTDPATPTGLPAPVRMTMLEANVDDLDPRLWPGVLSALLEARAADAWLVPILMKKGRPAHQLGVLCADQDADMLLGAVLRLVPTLGVRRYPVDRVALDRAWTPVDVNGHEIRIKVGSSGGRVRTATPEFEDVRRAAAALDLPEREVLDRARGAAAVQGLQLDAPAPARDPKGDPTG